MLPYKSLRRSTGRRFYQSGVYVIDLHREEYVCTSLTTAYAAMITKALNKHHGDVIRQLKSLPKTD